MAAVITMPEAPRRLPNSYTARRTSFANATVNRLLELFPRFRPSGSRCAPERASDGPFLSELQILAAATARPYGLRDRSIDGLLQRRRTRRLRRACANDILPAQQPDGPPNRSPCTESGCTTYTRRHRQALFRR